MELDLNCDLGEGEPKGKTRALMRACTSVNIACGGHAGNVESMVFCVSLAKELGVRVGAHPGAWDRAGAGRTEVHLTSAELELLLLQQIGALGHVCQKSGIALHHVKLHGALYHLTESDRKLGDFYLDCLGCWWPRSIVYVRAGGRLAKAAAGRGIKVWEEAFQDRGYRADGTLVPRNAPGALLDNAKEIVRRATAFKSALAIETVTGASLILRPQTACIHSDSPGSVQALRAVRRALDKH